MEYVTVTDTWPTPPVLHLCRVSTPPLRPQLAGAAKNSVRWRPGPAGESAEPSGDRPRRTYLSRPPRMWSSRPAHRRDPALPAPVPARHWHRAAAPAGRLSSPRGPPRRQRHLYRVCSRLKGAVVAVGAVGRWRAELRNCPAFG